MADSESRIVFSADATQMRKAIEAQLKDLSFNIADRSFTQVRTQIEKELKNKFTISIDIKGNSGQLKAFGDVTNQIVKQFDKIGEAKDRLASNFAEKFPKMIGQMVSLNTALSKVAKQFRAIGDSTSDIKTSKIKVTPVATKGSGGSTDEIRALTKENAQLAAQLDKVTKKYNEQTEAVKKSKNATIDFAEQTGRTTRRLTAYLLPAAGIFQISRGLGEAKDQIIDLNREIIKLTQVMGGNAEAANQAADDTLTIAKNMGQSGTELLKITNFLAQSGDKFSVTAGTLQDAVQAIAAANLGATFGDLEETVQGGLAYLNQFNKSGSDLIDILDSANSLSKGFAVEAKDIFEAVKTGGAAFSTLGGDVQQFEALVTAIRSLTRLPINSIGTAINFSALKLFTSKNIEFMQKLGVETYDTNGKLKDFTGLLKAVAIRFKDLGPTDKADVVEKIFGSRQSKVGFKVLEDLSSGASVLEKALKTAQNSSGSVFRDAQLGLSRIDVQIQSVGTSFQEFFKDLANDKSLQEFVKDIASGLKNVLEVLKEINSFGGILKEGGIIPSLFAVGGLFLARGALSNIGGFIKGLQGKGGTGSIGEKAGSLVSLRSARGISSNITETISTPTVNTTPIREKLIAAQNPKIASVLRTNETPAIRVRLLESGIEANRFEQQQIASRISKQKSDAEFALLGGRADKSASQDLLKIVREQAGIAGLGKAQNLGLTTGHEIFGALSFQEQRKILESKEFAALKAQIASTEELTKQQLTLIREEVKLTAALKDQETAAFRAAADVTFGPKISTIGRIAGTGRNIGGRLVGGIKNFGNNANKFLETGAGQALAFALPVALDAFAQNAISDRQELFGTDFDNNIVGLPSESIKRIRAQNISNQTSRGGITGLGFGASFGLIGGTVGTAGIGAIVGLVLGAASSYSNALKDNRESLLLAAEAAKTLNEAVSDSAVAFEDFTPKIGLGRFLTGFSKLPKSAITGSLPEEFKANKEDIIKELQSTPAGQANLQAIFRTSNDIAKRGVRGGLTDDQILAQIRSTITKNAGGNEPLSQAENEINDKRIKALLTTLRIDQKTSEIFEQLDKSLLDFIHTLTKQTEDLDLSLAKSSALGQNQNAALDFIKNPSGDFSTSNLASSIAPIIDQTFKVLGTRGEITTQNVGPISGGVLTDEQQKNAVFFSQVAGEIDKTFQNLNGIFRQFGEGESTKREQAISNALDTFTEKASGLADTPAQKDLVDHIKSLLVDQTQGDKGKQFDEKTADELRNKLIDKIGPLTKELPDLINKKLLLLAQGIDRTSKAFNDQVDVLKTLQDIQRQQVNTRLAQSERINALGVSPEQELGALRGIIGQVGDTNITGAATRFKNAQFAFQSEESAGALAFIQSGKGNAADFIKDLGEKSRQATKTQNEYTNAVQNSILKLDLLSKQFAIYQRQLGSEIQTLSNRGRASFGDVVNARIGLGQARGFGVLNGLQGITSQSDLLKLNPQDILSLSKRFANIPDSIAERIRQSFAFQGSSKLFPGGPTGDIAGQLFDVIRGLGRSLNPEESLKDLLDTIRDLNKTSDSMKDLEDAQNTAMASIALNVQEIAKILAGPDFKSSIDLDTAIKALVGKTGANANPFRIPPGVNLPPNVPFGGTSTNNTNPFGIPSGTNLPPNVPLQLRGPVGGSNVPTQVFADSANKAFSDLGQTRNDLFVKKASNVEIAGISGLTDQIAALIDAIEEAKRTGSNVQFSGDFNVFGLNEVAKDQATAGIVITVLQTFKDQLDTSDPAQAKLKDNLGQAIQQLKGQ